MDKDLSTYFRIGYYQKSYHFLYPLLGFKKDELFVPINTYLYCNAIDESIVDYKLLILYKFSDKNLFERFEKETLHLNPYIDTCYITEDGVLYIYNLSAFSGIVDKFLDGKYSEFTKVSKDTIIKFHKVLLAGKIIDPDVAASGNLKIKSGSLYHISVLYPEKMKKLVIKDMVTELDLWDSEIVLEQELKNVKELGDLFILEKETLNTKILEKKC